MGHLCYWRSYRWFWIINRLTHCPHIFKIAAPLLNGTWLRTVWGGITAKFTQQDKRPSVLQDGNKSETLGTAQKGKIRYRIIMTQEQVKDTETTTPGRGNMIGALRISGFKVKQEEPKDESLDAWCAEVVRTRRQGQKEKNRSAKGKRTKTSTPADQHCHSIAKKPASPRPRRNIRIYQGLDPKRRSPNILSRSPWYLRPSKR